jgi:cell division protein FtsN
VEEETQRSVTIKPVRTPSAKVRLRSETRDQGWDFDDLINYDAPAVESLSGASAPNVISAVTLGEGTETKKRVVSKTKTSKTKTAAKPSTKPSAKSAPKSTAKKPAAKKPAAKKTAVRKTKPIS